MSTVGCPGADSAPESTVAKVSSAPNLRASTREASPASPIASAIVARCGEQRSSSTSTRSASVASAAAKAPLTTSAGVSSSASKMRSRAPGVAPKSWAETISRFFTRAQVAARSESACLRRSATRPTFWRRFADRRQVASSMSMKPGRASPSRSINAMRSLSSPSQAPPSSRPRTVKMTGRGGGVARNASTAATSPIRSTRSSTRSAPAASAACTCASIDGAAETIGTQIRVWDMQAV